ncbi:MAG: hypothetical protein NWR54_07285, partial [Paracoccaceae bacterium]|nr:hypothetical protein [Paracoccaceae bacterium]
MVEKRGLGHWLTHLGLIIGVLFIFFPIWLAFVASTVTQPEIVRPPMPLLPGDRFVLRESGRDETIGGGEVLDIEPVLRASSAAPDRTIERVV